MKKATLCAALMLLGSLALQAVPTDVTYAEGEATIKSKAGKQQEASIGDVMNTGDTVRTGTAGLVELDQKGITLKLSPNTVLTLMERERGGGASPVLSVALGSLKLRFDKLTGKEPMIRTNGATGGVRGTELSVFSGADGSTLFVVDSGEVRVEAGGESVDLAAEEAVEVRLGQAPGGKFTVHRDQVDYAKWNEDKRAAMLADPAAAMTGIEIAMASYIKDVEQYDALFKEYSAKLADERAARVKITEAKGKGEGERYENEVVFPLMNQTSALGLNLRYSTLAALSLRRYVGGRLYLFLKAKYIARPDEAEWTGFLSRFNALLSDFEKSIAPHLVEADI